jgi:hypothetical protein
MLKVNHRLASTVTDRTADRGILNPRVQMPPLLAWSMTALEAFVYCLGKLAHTPQTL